MPAWVLVMLAGWVEAGYINVVKGRGLIGSGGAQVGYMHIQGRGGLYMYVYSMYVSEYVPGRMPVWTSVLQTVLMPCLR